MSNQAYWQRAILAALLVVVAAVAWVVFAPIQLGGQSAYVIVDGNSMEPAFHWGDLAVVRQASSYHAGDIVAYRNPQLGRVVFHRIIDTQGNHFILKGDHNSWNDSYLPVQSDVIGSLWFALPAAGAWIGWARQPLNMGLLAGILGGLLAVLWFRQRAGNRTLMDQSSLARWFGGLRRLFGAGLRGSSSLNSVPHSGRSSGDDGHSQPPGDLRRWSGTLEALFFGLGLIFFASLVLSYFAFSRPVQRRVDADIAYQHVGTFSYAATAPTGIYDSTSVQSGDPIFPALTCMVDMRFSYALAGIHPQSISGTVQMQAKIMDPPSGWQRTVQLTEPQPFTGTSSLTRAPIDLCQIEKLVADVQTQTGLQPGGFVLRLMPTVDLNGSVSGIALQDTFQPTLDFRFNQSVFSVVHDDPKANPLNVSVAGIIKHSVNQPNTMTILGRDFDVSRLRFLSGLGLLLSLAGVATLGFSLASMARTSDLALAEIKYGSLLADARQRNLDTSGEVIEIASLDDLAKLAERNQTLILFQKRDRISFYWVQAQGRTYRYAVSEGLGGTASVPLVELEDDLQRGLEEGEFEVYYQPIVSLSDGRIVGVEALLRWQHPEYGLIPAGDFIPAAEAAGLMTPLGDWLLSVACEQLRSWSDQGISLTLSVNLSEQQLRADPGGSLRRAVQNTGIDPHCLQIEIPGPEAMQVPERVITTLQDIKDLGIQISVDESTGSTAVSSLAQFPLTAIKFDRPVVEHINDRVKVLAVQRMIQAARGRGLQIAAVGVETEEQMEFLRSERFNFAQGYLVGRPVSADQLSRSLASARNPGSQRQPESA